MIVPFHHVADLPVLHLQLLKIRQLEEQGVDGAHGSL